MQMLTEREPTYLRMTEERAFAQELRQRYLELATNAYDRGELAHSDFYALRAIMAVEGKLVEPSGQGVRGGAGELSDARRRLNDALRGGVRLSSPGLAARAQAAYDCWRVEASAEGDRAIAAVCRENALAAIVQLEHIGVSGKLATAGEARPAPRHAAPRAPAAHGGQRSASAHPVAPAGLRPAAPAGRSFAQQVARSAPAAPESYIDIGPIDARHAPQAAAPAPTYQPVPASRRYAPEPAPEYAVQSYAQPEPAYAPDSYAQPAPEYAVESYAYAAPSEGHYPAEEYYIENPGYQAPAAQFDVPAASIAETYAVPMVDLGGAYGVVVPLQQGDTLQYVTSPETGPAFVESDQRLAAVDPAPGAAQYSASPSYRAVPVFQMAPIEDSGPVMRMAPAMEAPAISLEAAPATDEALIQTLLSARAPGDSSYAVYFGFDSDEVTPEAADVLVDALEQAIIEDRNTIVLMGFTDSAGDARYNQLLAMRRTQGVRKFLEERSDRPLRFEMMPVGEAEAVRDGGDGVIEALNRKVEIRVR